MNIKKSLLITIGMLVVGSMVLVGCAPATPQVPGTPQIVVQTVTVKETPQTVEITPTSVPEAPMRLANPGKLTIGYTPVPGVTDVVNGKAVGAFGILLDEAAAKMGLEPVWQIMDFPALIPAVQSGRIDLVSGFSITQSRARIMYVSIPFFLQPDSISTMPGTQISSWEEAAAKHLTLATNVGFYYEQQWESLGIKVHSFDTKEACFLDVVHGGAAGCAVGTFDLIYLKATQPQSELSKLVVSPISGPMITADLNAAAVNKNNPALARALNQALTDLWRGGQIETAFAQTFPGADYQLFINPPEGVAYYINGPWETDTVPPASAVYPKDVATISAGTLTVGVAKNSALLKLDGEQPSGPEAEILRFAAEKLGLSLKGIAISDAAAAVQGGNVDLVAGALPATKDASYQYWQSTPIGFNPDYIYVMPGKDGSFPAWASWEDVKKAGGKVAIATDNPRINDLKASGVSVLEVNDAAAGFKALVDGSAQGFVGTTIDYVVAASGDPTIANAGIGWVRNVDTYSYGEAYIWGVKTGNGKLLDALNQAITAAWQQKLILQAYTNAFPGANVTSLTAPGPAAVGTSYGSSEDYLFRSMWVPGPWLQRPTWVKK